MQALTSYNAQGDPDIQMALQDLRDIPDGLFPSLVLSERGAFIKFEWADWPETLSAKLSERVKAFLLEHPTLYPIDEGSEDWKVTFPGESDGETAAEIGSRLEAHFPGRLDWVIAERDRRGKITANSLIEHVGEILWHLSWRHVSADPANPKLNVQDVQPLNAAILEISKWAGSRIQPILDALQERLKALYGDRFRRMYVFGSYARQDAGIDLGENSDLDVALILNDLDNLYDERERFGDIVYDLSLEHGLVISVVPIREVDFREGQTNFTRVISQYAVPVK